MANWVTLDGGTMGLPGYTIMYDVDTGNVAGFSNETQELEYYYIKGDPDSNWPGTAPGQYATVNDREMWAIDATNASIASSNAQPEALAGGTYTPGGYETIGGEAYTPGSISAETRERQERTRGFGGQASAWIGWPGGATVATQPTQPTSAGLPAPLSNAIGAGASTAGWMMSQPDAAGTYTIMSPDQTYAFQIGAGNQIVGRWYKGREDVSTFDPFAQAAAPVSGAKVTKIPYDGAPTDWQEKVSGALGAAGPIQFYPDWQDSQNRGDLWAYDPVAKIFTKQTTPAWTGEAVAPTQRIATREQQAADYGRKAAAVAARPRLTAQQLGTQVGWYGEELGYTAPVGEMGTWGGQGRMRTGKAGGQPGWMQTIAQQVASGESEAPVWYSAAQRAYGGGTAQTATAGTAASPTGGTPATPTTPTPTTEPTAPWLTNLQTGALPREWEFPMAGQPPFPTAEQWFRMSQSEKEGLQGSVESNAGYWPDYYDWMIRSWVPGTEKRLQPKWGW